VRTIGAGINGNYNCSGDTFGETCTGTCQEGFEGTVVTRTCQSDGTWSDADLACTPISCGSANEFADSQNHGSNDQILCQGEFYDDTCFAICKEGFEPTGQTVSHLHIVSLLLSSLIASITFCSSMASGVWNKVSETYSCPSRRSTSVDPTEIGVCPSGHHVLQKTVAVMSVFLAKVRARWVVRTAPFLC
jgi:hypothetical protein